VIATQVGAYRLLQQIGQGGMGTVWLAEHTILGRRAAIKLLHPMFTVRDDIVMRFFNEARAITTISDPGIVQIFDFGYHVDGSAYIAMEMLDGEPLDRRLHRLGRMHVADALRVMRQVTSTIGVAHQHGIVHRDLKPANIFLVHDPEVMGGERAKVLDFGIAKLTGDQNVKTSTSSMIGTPAYMSPEQCRAAGQVDQRSDVYSLGCVLFALITGSPPFDAESSGETIAMHLRDAPPAPSSCAAGIPTEVDALVLRCLEKEPAKRYASAAELAAEIGRVLRLVSDSSSPVMPAPKARWGDSLATTRVVMTEHDPAPGPRAGKTTTVRRTAPVLATGDRRGLFAAIAVAIAASAAAAVAVMHIGSSSSPSPSPRSDELAASMQRALTIVIAWSRTHAGAPCPTFAALGPAVNDPWGNPLEITCTDQPASQIVGVISAGPDGALGTQDDVGSWQLGRDITDIVRGARWTAGAASPPPDATDTPPDIELVIEYSPEATDWFENALAEFQRTRPWIHITTSSKNSFEAARAILDGKDRPVLWSPADSQAIALLASERGNRTHSELFSSSEDAAHPLLLTPLVFVGWEERVKRMTGPGGHLSWRAIHKAVASPKGWAGIGGRPDWGLIKVGHADPSKANSGLQSLVLMACEYFHTTAELTIDQVLDPKFREFVADIDRTAPYLESATSAMTEMIRFGPSKYDLVAVYESVAISQVKRAQGRWGKLHIYYPPVTVWSDFPIVQLDGPWVTEDQKRAATQLIAFLRSPSVQASALRFGFRPADPSVPIKIENAELFAASKPYGLSLDLPAAARPLDGTVIRAMLTTWTRTLKTRQ